jgi:hypothetical protein
MSAKPLDLPAAVAPGLLVHCADYRCSHLKTMAPADLDKWPNRVRLSDSEPRFICQRCGTRGVDVRLTFLRLGWVQPHANYHLDCSC